MKSFLKLFTSIFIFSLLSLFFNPVKHTTHKLQKDVRVEQKTSYELEEELTESIDEQLEEIDFSGLDKIISNLDDSQRQIFKHKTFTNLVKDLIDGNDFGNFEDLFSYLINLIFKDILEILPYFLIIIVISLICNIAQQMSSPKSESIKKIISVSSFCIVATIFIGIVAKLLSLTTVVINSISDQSEVIFPILLTLVTALGGAKISATTGAIVGIFTSVIIKIFVAVLIPIVIFSFTINVIENFNSSIKFEKLSKLFSSIFNWCIGLIFTTFVGFLGIKGLLSSGLDGVSLKATKYAIKNYIPILGSYLSDSVSIIMASTGIIKNAIGISGLILIISTILSPIIKILVVIMMLKISSAILEPLSDGKISNFLFNSSKSLNMLNICIIAIGVMYLISVYALLLLSNLF